MNPTAAKDGIAGTLISVNVGRVQRVGYRGKEVRTGIYKTPVAGPAFVGRLNLEGDEQADLTVHGGLDKAVYVYPAEHYPAWTAELKRDFGFGQFGENLTVSGLLEDAIRTGDLLQIETVVLQITDPRLPCFKLGIKMGDQRFLRRFLQSGRSGFYCRVIEEGSVEAGQAIRLISSDESSKTIAEMVRRARD
jgi:MOSC domain-containing protein YiiM